jgi:hypothetical protein
LFFCPDPPEANAQPTGKPFPLFFYPPQTGLNDKTSLSPWRLPSQTAQTLLRALDALVDMGDRRAAAIHTSEVFKDEPARLVVKGVDQTSEKGSNAVTIRSTNASVDGLKQTAKKDNVLHIGNP